MYPVPPEAGTMSSSATSLFTTNHSATSRHARGNCNQNSTVGQHGTLLADHSGQASPAIGPRSLRCLVVVEDKAANREWPPCRSNLSKFCSAERRVIGGLDIGFPSCKAKLAASMESCASRLGHCHGTNSPDLILVRQVSGQADLLP